MNSDFDDFPPVLGPSLNTLDLPVSRSIVFDIETGPAWSNEEHAKEYLAELGIVYKCEANHPGEFDESSVKLGNLKNQAKIQEKIDRARESHSQLVESYETNLEKLEADFWSGMFDKAALSPITGTILAIGYLHEGEINIDEGDEADLVRRFWQKFEEARPDHSLIGWNINGFDVPFMVSRSAFLGVQVPRGLFARGKWLSDTFVDLMLMWGQQHDPWKQKREWSSAKNIARFLRVDVRDADEIEGKDFWKYWKTDREKAVAYLMHDVQEEGLIAHAFGVI